MRRWTLRLPKYQHDFSLNSFCWKGLVRPICGDGIKRPTASRCHHLLNYCWAFFVAERPAAAARVFSEDFVAQLVMALLNIFFPWIRLTTSGRVASNTFCSTCFTNGPTYFFEEGIAVGPTSKENAPIPAPELNCLVRSWKVLAICITQ